MITGPFAPTGVGSTASRARIFVCTPKTEAEEPACARRIVTNLATKAFRRPATPADVDLLMEFYTAGRAEGAFENGIEMVLARILAERRP